MLSEGRPIITNSANYLLYFIGGFFGALTHYINSFNMLFHINFRELIDFTVHSLIGGAIMLGVKVIGDYLLYLIKGNRNKKDE